MKINIPRVDKRTFLNLFLGVLIFVGALIFVDHLIHWGRIHHGVRVSGIPVGHLTPEEAVLKLSTKQKAALIKPVTLRHADRTWVVYPAQFDTKVNITKTVKKAFGVGRVGGIFHRPWLRLCSWFEPVDIPLIYSVDQKLLSQFVNGVAGEVDREPINAGIKIRGTEVEIAPSQIGMKLRRPETFTLVRRKLVALKNREADLPVDILPVELTEKDVAEAYNEVKLFLSAPIVLKYDKYSWELKPEEISELVAFERTKVGDGESCTLAVCLDEEKIKGYIGEITRPINIDPRNAQFNVVGKKVTIIPSQNGLKIDEKAAFSLLEQIIRLPAPREVLLLTKVMMPKITTEKARAMGIKEEVAKYTTSYNPKHTARVHNIHLLAKELDGAIIAPGEIFSFNKVVGDRTAEEGYQEAPMILNGELVPAIGGGVCQVGTTIFNTAFFGGYEIVERQCHSFYISRYPAGRDATVSYPSPDFKFKNDTSAYLLIKTSYTASTVTVAFYSTDFNTEVSYSATPFTNLKPYTTKYVEDPTLLKGQEKVEQEGVEGRDITVYRTVKRDGALVRKNKFFSRYRPKQAVVQVGTMEPPIPTEETTSTPNSEPAEELPH
ncbi:MAG: VanW family protein [Actinomycetota bacterium]|nr:VanW family protein [Actinomycetota bacterium]